MSRKGKPNPKLSIARKGKHYPKLSEAMKGKHNGNEFKKGQPATEGSFKGGHLPWNKGRTDVYSEEMLQQMSESAKKRMPSNKGKHWKVSKEGRKNLSKGHEGLRHSVETINRMKISARQVWSNPEYAESRFRKLGIKPNQDELYLDAILQLNFPKEWKYVGDGKVWIEGKNPDFINCNGKKIVIEYNGYKGHGQHTLEKDQAKTEHYAKYGFKTINIYPKELKNESLLVETIKSYEGGSW